MPWTPTSQFACPLTHVGFPSGALNRLSYGVVFDVRRTLCCAALRTAATPLPGLCARPCSNLRPPYPRRSLSGPA